MTIDIIDYTESQYAALSSEKLEKVRAAQIKKNGILAELSELLKKEKHHLMNRGVFPSTIYEQRAAELTAKYQAKVDEVREGLLFYLHYATNEGTSGDTTNTTQVPYTVEYSLSAEERLTVVRSYYEQTYSNGAERFEAFKKDSFAKSYLGEYYAPLYYRFQDDA